MNKNIAKSLSNKFKKVVLVHAVRYAKELTYQKTISELKEKYGERFTPCKMLRDMAAKNESFHKSGSSSQAA